MFITLIFLLFGVTIVTRISSRIRKAFSELEALPTTPSATVHQADSEEAVQQEPYFSYESEMSDEVFYSTSRPATTRPEPVVSRTVDPLTTSNRTDGFDLRQAVVYQTILHNPYWDESR